ncbi:MAG TPA: short-chain dehydrogenase [Planctomycetaceae bacterium]|nr:short-chain dehydrogenase [Planctomycetaceae bacterium]
MSVFKLDNKVALVTGGGSGIGKAISLLFSEQGAQVVILDRNESESQEVLREIEAGDGSGMFLACDVSQGENVNRVVEQVIKQFGRIDILVNNAGIAHVGNVEKTSEEDLDRVYNVNVKGVYHCTRAVIPSMVEQGGGVIANLASIASKIGLKDRFAYSMSKGAVFTMTLSTAIDYIDKKIRCNCVCPARVHTPFVDGYLKDNYPGREEEIYKSLAEYQPLGRMGKPEEIAAALLYLCSDEAAFVTGCALSIDGGVTSLV